MRYAIALLCLTATLVSPLFRQSGAALLIARAIETASPVETDDDLEAPIEEADDGEEAALRLSVRRDVLSDPRLARLLWVRAFPDDLTLPPDGRRHTLAYLAGRSAAAWPSDSAAERHAWLQVFRF
ncbi:MAG: hypothetical protein P4L84_13885 [Isosphaeraceae bacterium]|nr:hypothetical protein [Isosphaeraceae bacterium]